MEKITTIEQLKKEIILLEIKQAHERALLNEQFQITYESLKPANLIKKTISDLVHTPDLKGGILSTVASIAAGYLSKKVVVGSSPGPVKSLLGSALQMLVTKFVSNKAESMRAKQNEEDEELEKDESNVQYTPD